MGGEGFGLGGLGEGGIAGDGGGAAGGCDGGMLGGSLGGIGGEGGGEGGGTLVQAPHMSGNSVAT